MLKNKTLKEGTSGEIEICDTSCGVMETLLFFLYHDFVDKKKINSDLLKTADKYLVGGLVDVCVLHLSTNLTCKNALDVMVAAYQTNQKNLFDAAFKFAWENKGKLVKTDSWNEMLRNYPDLIAKAFSQSL